MSTPKRPAGLIPRAYLPPLHGTRCQHYDGAIYCHRERAEHAVIPRHIIKPDREAKRDR